jgi:hypothetical protein
MQLSLQLRVNSNSNKHPSNQLHQLACITGHWHESAQDVYKNSDLLVHVIVHAALRFAFSSRLQQLSPITINLDRNHKRPRNENKTARTHLLVEPQPPPMMASSSSS